MGDGENDYLAQAGTAALYAVARVRETSSSTENPSHVCNYDALFANARRLLALADPKEDPHRFAAIKDAIESYEAAERGENPLGMLEIFDAHVEAVHGGPRNIDFGGVRVPNKPTAKEAFLRAGAVALWDKFPEGRDTLVKEAKHILKIENKRALAKLVENYHQRHDMDLNESKSPLSIHMPRVRELIEKFGYRTLQDFL